MKVQVRDLILVAERAAGCHLGARSAALAGCRDDLPRLRAAGCGAACRAPRQRRPSGSGSAVGPAPAAPLGHAAEIIEPPGSTGSRAGTYWRVRRPLTWERWVEPGNDPGRDEYGLPPADIEIPDDARDLD